MDFCNEDCSEISFEYCDIDFEAWSNFFVCRVHRLRPIPFTDYYHFSPVKQESDFNFETLSSSHATDDSDATNISVSTAFHSSTNVRPGEPINLILASIDTIFFYVHTSHVLAASSNCLNMLALLPCASHQGKQNYQNQLQNQNLNGTSSGSEQLQVVHLPERGTVLNIILLAIYELPIATYAPTFGDIITAVDAMPKYGFSVEKYVAPGTGLFDIVLAHAPLYPLEVYTLASAYGLTDLAQKASVHLLSFTLAKLSDEMAEKMGAVALKNLFLLHKTRLDAVRSFLIHISSTHLIAIYS